MNEVQRLIAYEEIRQLASRYALALDSRDLDALVGLFVDDVQVGRQGTGREILRADFDRQLHQVGITILHVTGHVIDVDNEDHASGVVSCRGEVQVDDRWITQAIQYRDSYERRKGRWYFARREHLLWYGAEVGENPLLLPPANWPERHTGRGTLPESLESWQRFWNRNESD